MAENKGELSPILDARVSDTEKQVAKLQGAYEHLATRADLEKLRADLTWRFILGMIVLMAFIEWRVVG